MKTFFKRFLLFISPLLLYIVLCVTSYILIDPFRVLSHQTAAPEKETGYSITLNQDYQSTEFFLRNYKTYNYNSFIFGNSRAIFYQADYWNTFVKGSPFHFEASTENIFGIYGKLRYLDQIHADLRNVLIIADNSVLEGVLNPRGHLFLKHPITSGQSPLAFQFECFRAYATSFGAMCAYTELAITGRRREYMDEYGIREKGVWKHNDTTNQLTYDLYDRQIAADPESYYGPKREMFYRRDSIIPPSAPVIGAAQTRLLTLMRDILVKNHTNFKIVISPLYDQRKLNPQDLSRLNEIFGPGHIYDFSGKNSFTEDYHNYYETSHYRLPVTDSIISMIYR